MSKMPKPCRDGWESADPGAGSFTPNPCVRCGWSAEDHAKFESIRAHQDAIETLIAPLRKLIADEGGIVTGNSEPLPPETVIELTVMAVQSMKEQAAAVRCTCPPPEYARQPHEPNCPLADVEGVPAVEEEPDEEMVPHAFVALAGRSRGPNDDECWCVHCEYHRDHEIHQSARTQGVPAVSTLLKRVQKDGCQIRYVIEGHDEVLSFSTTPDAIKVWDLLRRIESGVAAQGVPAVDLRRWVQHERPRCFADAIPSTNERPCTCGLDAALQGVPSAHCPEHCAPGCAITQVQRVVDKFQADEQQGYRSRDRQYAIEMVSKGLARLPQPGEPAGRVLDSLPAAVSPESPIAKQMVSNSLRHNEQHFHNQLMETPIACWPESLKDLADARQRQLGLCGDVIASAVADWIAQRAVPARLPPQPEPRK